MPEKTIEPGRKPAKKPKPEVVEQIPLLDLHPFPDHPFQVRDDDAIIASFWQTNNITESRK